MRGECSGGRLQAAAGIVMPGLGRGQLRPPGCGIGQLRPAGLGRGLFGFGNLALFGQVSGSLGQFGAAGFVPGLGSFGLVHRAQRRTLGLGGCRNRAFRGDDRHLQFGQFRLDGRGATLGRGNRSAFFRQLGFQRGQPVFGLKPGGFGGAFALADKAIPAPDPPAAGHQPFARAKRAAIVAGGDMDQRQSGLQLVGTLGDMGGQAVLDRSGLGCAGPKAAILVCRSLANWRLGIAAQHCGKGALIARRGSHLVQRHRQAVLTAGLLGAGIAVAHQRLPFALDAGQFGLGRGQGGRGNVARGLQFAFARLLAFHCGTGGCELLGRGIAGPLGLGQGGGGIAFGG